MSVLSVFAIGSCFHVLSKFKNTFWKFANSIPMTLLDFDISYRLYFCFLRKIILFQPRANRFSQKRKSIPSSSGSWECASCPCLYCDHLETRSLCAVSPRHYPISRERTEGRSRAWAESSPPRPWVRDERDRPQRHEYRRSEMIHYRNDENEQWIKWVGPL